MKYSYMYVDKKENLGCPLSFNCSMLLLEGFVRCQSVRLTLNRCIGKDFAVNVFILEIGIKNIRK